MRHARLDLLLQLALGAALLSAPGCGAEADEAPTPDETATTAEALFNGTAATTASLPGSGVVVISSTQPGGGTKSCSGVLLTNRWVLSARHCFCATHVTNPGTVAVSVYGKDLVGDPNMPVYSSTASQVVRHPTMDAALIKLSQSLPFTTPPLISTDVLGVTYAGMSGTVWGFGMADGSHGIEQAGFTLRSGGMNLIAQFQTTAPMSNQLCGTDPNETVNMTTGPYAQGVSTPTGPVFEAAGDSGGPLFLNGSLHTRVLLGVVHGAQSSFDAHTGVALLSSWVHQSAPDISRASTCGGMVTGSSGAGPAAVAEGPDGAVHIVAPVGGVLKHWIMSGLAVVAQTTITGTLTDDAPGLGLESSGTPKKLGVAYRERTTNKLRYARWSAAGGWSAPLTMAGVTLATGPAMTKGGAIAFVKTDNRVYLSSYTGTAFATTVGLPTSAPLADPTKRVSVAFEPAFGGVTQIGYRTTTGAWIQATGSGSCPTYFCGTDPAFANTWWSAALAYTTGQRTTIVTTQTSGGNPFPLLQNRVRWNGSNLAWGDNRSVVPAPPGVTQIGTTIWLAYQNFDGNLYIRRGDNCLADEF